MVCQVCHQLYVQRVLQNTADNHGKVVPMTQEAHLCHDARDKIKRVQFVWLLGSKDTSLLMDLCQSVRLWNKRRKRDACMDSIKKKQFLSSKHSDTWHIVSLPVSSPTHWQWNKQMHDDFSCKYHKTRGLTLCVISSQNGTWYTEWNRTPGHRCRWLQLWLVSCFPVRKSKSPRAPLA